jgi:hypothetical protein
MHFLIDTLFGTQHFTKTPKYSLFRRQVFQTALMLEIYGLAMAKRIHVASVCAWVRT